MYTKSICVILVLIGVVGINTQEEFVSPVLSTRKNNNWFNFLGKTYYVNSIFQTNFFSAMQFCRQQGMHLLSINNEHENQKIGKVLKDRGFNANNRYYTSGNNLGEKEKWVWFSSGNEVTYFNWYPGEPNKFANSENCMEVGWLVGTEGTVGFTWNDIGCLEKKYFICEATTDCSKLQC